MFYQLFFISASLFMLYVALVYSYKNIRNVSTEQAAKKIKKWIAKEFEALTCSPQPLEYNPTMDEDIQIALLDALAPYNALRKEYVYMDWIPYLGTSLPSILIELIPNNGEKDFDLIKSIMKTLVYNHLAYRNFPSPLVDVTISKNNNNYFIWIVYATTPENRKLFCDHYNNKAFEARRQAQKLVAPVIDSDLEKELIYINNTDMGDKNV